MADAIHFGDYEPEESPHPEDQVKVDFTFGLFIDGTLNSRYNTEAREAYERVQKSASGGTEADRELASHYPTGGSLLSLFRGKSAEQQAYERWLRNEPHDRDLAASYAPKDDSYENSLSNVAILSRYYEDNRTERRFMVYTEGIGTTPHGNDSLEGYATGGGRVPEENGGKPDTGIIGKVRKNIEEVVKYLERNRTEEIGKITIDVFGFSRGAAAVRHLVHDLTQAAYRPQQKDTVLRDGQGYPVQESQLKRGLLPKWGYLGLLLQDAEIEVDSIVIRFAGLFDTVAHYTPVVSGSWLARTSSLLLQRDDVRQLGLDAIARARTVIHLTAADEHRYNFDLDTIRSVGVSETSLEPDDGLFLSPTIPITRGLEKSMPGVHSDLGGGYREDAPEVKSLLFYANSRAEVEARKALLLQEGWYQENQLFISSPAETSFILRGFRRKVSNQYSLIPLHFMCELAVSLQSVPLKDTQLLRDYKFKANHVADNIAFLQNIKNLLRPYVFENGPALTLTAPLPATDRSAAAQTSRQRNTNLKKLRNHYLHWSANGYRLTDPHKPANAERIRDVHPG